MKKKYLYRREDNGEIVEVDWETMMTQRNGYITLDDGVDAKRCVHLEDERYGKPERQSRKVLLDRPIVSDNLGFGQHQYAEMEEDRRRNGFTDVEFVRDPHTPEFYQVHCGSRKSRDAYARHRSFSNSTSIGGVRFTKEELEGAMALVSRVYTPQ